MIREIMRFSEIKTHLSKFRVGIAGAGGLGSNCAVALARSGVGTLVISDFDIVEEPNLNRQYYFIDQVGLIKTVALKENIARINPEVHVIVHQKILEKENITEIFSGCDIIVEAFDSSSMKGDADRNCSDKNARYSCYCWIRNGRVGKNQ